MRYARLSDLSKMGRIDKCVKNINIVLPFLGIYYLVRTGNVLFGQFWMFYRYLYYVGIQAP